MPPEALVGAVAALVRDRLGTSVAEWLFTGAAGRRPLATARRPASRTRPTQAPRALGHGAWHVEHVRLEGTRAVAVYEWDSLMEAPEQVLVGCAVGGFTADWSVDDPPVVARLAVALLALFPGLDYR
jgi:hypothetical protein